MSAGYDPFKWADVYESEEEYFDDLKVEKINMTNTIEIDLDNITKRMDELKDAKARYTFELKQIEKEMKKEELKLIALLDQTGVNSMQHGTYYFGWKTTSRMAFDQKLFGSEYPDLLEQYSVKKENKVFEFKVGV